MPERQAFFNYRQSFNPQENQLRVLSLYGRLHGYVENIKQNMAYGDYLSSSDCCDYDEYEGLQDDFDSTENTGNLEGIVSTLLNIGKTVAKTAWTGIKFAGTTVAKGVTWSAKQAVTGASWLGKQAVTGASWTAKQAVAGANLTSKAVASSASWLGKQAVTGATWTAKAVSNVAKSTYSFATKTVPAIAKKAFNWGVKAVSNVAGAVWDGTKWVARQASAGFNAVGGTLISLLTGKKEEPSAAQQAPSGQGQPPAGSPPREQTYMYDSGSGQYIPVTAGGDWQYNPQTGRYVETGSLPPSAIGGGYNNYYDPSNPQGLTPEQQAQAQEQKKGGLLPWLIGGVTVLAIL